MGRLRQVISKFIKSSTGDLRPDPVIGVRVVGGIHIQTGIAIIGSPGRGRKEISEVCAEVFKTADVIGRVIV